ncbi:probable flap endonuclease 1 homolog isoform X2 [Lepidochelys kempii]|uniref:probable flap endonuclease 1 homolog isoform X2 n=1 Tax=Lepidochelys kempii TaxID=8472 RepID=UPI003C6F56BE
MGIVRLADVIKEEAAEAVSSFPLQQYRDRIIALDASIAIYQFRTAMPKIFNRNGENISWPGGQRLPGRGETLQAPAEAEATCAALVKSGKVWCTATEDMDALPFGSLRLIRHLSAKKSCEVEEFSLPAILQKLGMTQEQFVDLCILLGCDYCGKIWRLGPKKALRLLQQHGTIEQVLQNIDSQKHPLPTNWDLEGARRLFLQPEVADPGQITLEWHDPDPEGLVQFLAREKHMNESRVCRRLQRWHEAQPKPKEAQPKQQVPQEGRRQRKLGDFFPASKRARPPEVPSPRPSRKRQKLQAGTPGKAGSPEPGK